MFLPSCVDFPSPTSVKLLKTLSSRATSDAPDLWVAVTIIFSATTYFFDYGSNIATAWKYYILEYRNESSEVQIRAEGPRSEFPGIFPGILAVILVAHIINALVFYLHLDKTREALKCAYLLPVVYLRKLALLAWRTGHLQGVRDLRSNDIDAIYNILAAALETGPQLILQFHVFAELGYLSHAGQKAPTVLVLSLAASFVSGAYNGGLAMATSCEKATLLGRTSMGTVGGLHIVSALLLRSIAFELITEEGFYHSSSPFRYYWFYLILVVAIPCTAFWILLQPSNSTNHSNNNNNNNNNSDHLEENQEQKQQTHLPNWKLFLKVISYSYVSITLGPLYPLTTHSKRNKQHTNRASRIRLLNASLVHFSLDLFVVLFVCGAHGRTWLTPCYLEWSREKDRRIHTRLFHQQFISCSSFKALLASSLFFYLFTLLLFLILDAHTRDQLENRSSFPSPGDDELQQEPSNMKS